MVRQPQRHARDRVPALIEEASELALLHLPALGIQVAEFIA